MSQTVARAIEVLRFIGERPRTLGEVARVTGTHKSTALRLLQTLVAGGFARQDAASRYEIGFGLISLAHRSLNRLDLRAVARPRLQALVDDYGHTVHLAQRVDDGIRYIDKIDGRGPVAMGSRVAEPVELHTAAISKAILAFLDDGDRRRLEGSIAFERFTPTTIVTPERFDEELETTRARGWAEDDGEKEDYLVCVAAPVLDGRGDAIAGLSITALRAACPLDELRQAVPALREAAAAVSRDLGEREAPA